MRMKIIEIEGIGEKYAVKLKRAGYEQVEDLLPLSEKDKTELAKRTKISRKLIDKWQEQADLMRLTGVGPEYAEALNLIGIDSVKELAQRNPANTLTKMQEMDKERPNVIRRIPSVESLEKWITEAKKIK